MYCYKQQWTDDLRGSDTWLCHRLPIQLQVYRLSTEKCDLACPVFVKQLITRALKERMVLADLIGSGKAFNEHG